MSLRLIACLLTLALSACSDSERSEKISAEMEALAAAKAKWHSAAIHDYQYTLAKSCFCVSSAEQAGGGTYVVTVKDDVVESAREKDSGEPLSDAQASSLPTVDELFVIIEDAYERDADEVIVEYDAERGFPSRTSVDEDKALADEEFGYLVSDLAPN